EVEAAEMLVAAMAGRAPRGVSATRGGFEHAVRRHSKEGFKLYYLHEDGEDFSRLEFGGKAAFVLGDQKGIDPHGERCLESMGAKRVSLGPHPYLASHCITIVRGMVP
ncbi:MAG: tRNA (pseudouridine(54)-N(1))-methyltransferase TrmY, partial [Candidatus Methanosuratincola sp.]